MRARVLLPIAVCALLIAPAALAQDGRVPAAEPTCQRGDALLAQGYLDEAEAAFKALLGSEACASRGLAAVARARERPISKQAFDAQIGVIRRLQGNGFEDEARERLQKLVERTEQTLPQDVRSLDDRTPEWRRWLGGVLPDLRTAAEVGVLVILGLLALRLLTSLVARMFRGMRLTGFDGSDQPGLSDALTGALHDALDRLKETAPRQQLHWVSATEGDFNLPTTLSTNLPQIALAAELLSLLDRLVPRRVLLISGTVRAVDSARGAGLTMTVRKRHGPVHLQQTVWEADFDLPVEGEERLAARYAQLVLPATVWLAFELRAGRSRPLGSTDWRSYARFAVAELHHRAGDLAQARMGYESALDSDPNNLGARLNLASLLLHRPPDRPESAQQARARLEAAGRLVRGVVERSPDPKRAIWYRARLLSAVQSLYADDAQAPYARDMLATVDAQIHKQLGQDRGMDAFLESMHDPLDVIWQIARLRAGEPPEIVRIEQLDWKSADTLYNLACFYSIRYGLRREEADRTLALDRLAERLERARTLRRLDLAREWARTDPDFDPLRDDPRFVELTAPAPAPQPKPYQERVGEAVGERVAALIAALGDEDGAISV